MTNPEQPEVPKEAGQPDPSRPFAKSWAVVIGIDEYGAGIPKLLNAVRDAGRVASTLRDKHGYALIQLTNKEATQERVKQLLYKELPEMVKEDHRVFFYWAGHGVKTASDTGPDGYLLPSDARKGEKATYLHMPGVHDALLDLKCRHMMVVLDTCFSGAFRWSGMRDIGREEGEVIQKWKYWRFVQDPAWQVISSASMDQRAADELPIGLRGGDAEHHSPFALALFQGLDGKADLLGGEKGGGDGLVTAHELYLYIDDQLARATKDQGIGQKAQLWPLKKHDKGEYVFQVDELKLAPNPELTTKNNPWVGLRSYEEEQVDLFFGRKPQIEGLFKQVEENALTVVFGASGTGKSSLVKAGLIPRLNDGWHVLPVMRPGASPLKALRQALDPDYTATITMELPSATGAHARPTASGAPAGTASRTRAADNVQRSVKIQGLVRKLLAEHGKEKVVLVVDRFEELITLSPSAARDAFLKLLADLLDEHDRLRLVVTVRSDFEPSFHSTVLGERWKKQECRFRVDPMSRDDLRKVIELPAAKRVLYFDPSALVEKLVDEVAATPGALPLLSFALNHMYIAYLTRRGDDRAINQGDYDALGGVAGALRKRADEVYDGMEPELQATLQHLMLRMVVREGGHLAGRRVTAAELVFPDDAENARCKEVVDRLTAEGLLVQDSEHGEAFVEPAHDALIREWERLQTWVRELDEASAPTAPGAGGRRRLYTLEQRHRLTRAADEWEEADKKAKSGLEWSDRVRGAQLKPLVKPRAPWLNRRELDFAERSIHGRRRKDVYWYSTGLLIALLAITSFAFGIRATVLAALATSRQLAAETKNALAIGDLDLAGLLAVEASALPAPDVRSPLLTWQLTTPKLRGYLRDTSGVYTVALSPDGETIASAQAPAPTAPGTRGWLESARASWRSLFGRGDDARSQALEPRPCEDSTVSTVVLWDLTSRKSNGTLCKHNGRVLSLAYGGRDSTTTLAALTTDGAVYLWDANARQPRDTLRGDSAAVMALAFSPNGKLLARTKDSRIILWELRGPQRPSGRTRRRDRDEPGKHPGAEAEAAARRDTRNTPPRSRIIDSLIEHQGPIRSISFSPDNQTLASVTDSGVTLWRITRRPGYVVDSGETFWSISQGNPRLWPKIYQGSRADSLAQPHWIFPGDVLDQGFETKRRGSLRMSNVVSVAFSPDGRTLAVAGKDTTVHLWDVSRTGRPFDQPLRGRAGTVLSLAFSPDSQTLATAGDDGTVILWDVARRQSRDTLRGHSGAVTDLAFGRDGRTLVSASEDGKVVVWDIKGRQARGARYSLGLKVTLMTGQDGKVTVGTPSFGPTRGPFTIAFTPDTTATADSGAVVRWDLGPEPGGAFSVARSPVDSNIFATGSADGTVILWDVTQQGHPKGIDTLPRGHADTVLSVAFSPSGDILASVGVASTIILWNLRKDDHPKIDPPLPGRWGRITSIAFSPSDDILASANADGTIIRWDIRKHKVSGRPLRGRAGAVLSVAFSPDGLTLASAHANGTVILWDVANERRRGAALRALSGAVRSVAFSPDTTTLAAVSDDGSVTFWNFRLDSLKHRACEAAGRNLSRSEWDESFRDRYERACSQYPGNAQVSGEGLWERIVNGAVRRLAHSQTLLNVLGSAWKWLWLLLLFPWVWLWRKGRQARRTTQSVA